MSLIPQPAPPAVIPDVPVPVPKRTDRANFALRADLMMGWFEQAIPIMKAVVAYINNVVLFVKQESENAQQALNESQNQALIAEQWAGTAMFTSHYKGPWATIAAKPAPADRVLQMPACMSHGGLFYALNNDLADVATAEPGASVAWSVLPGVTEIGTPSNVAPADAAVNVGAQAAITLQGSAFASIYTSDTFAASQWQLHRFNSFMVPDFDSGAVAGAASFMLPEAWALAPNTQYYWRVRHKSSRGTWSAWSRATAFVTAAAYGQYIPNPVATPAIGAAFLGGYYAGTVWNEIARATEVKTIAVGAGTVITLDAANSMYATPLVYVGQQLEVRSRANPANKFIGTVVSANRRALTLNVTAVGGAGTFSDWSVMSRFRKILAPKASGQGSNLAYKSTNTAAPVECITTNEGLRATLAMCAAGDATVYPAAWFCRSLNIGGYTDWFFPARDEMELVSRYFMPSSGSTGTSPRGNATTRTYATNGAYGDATTGQCENLNSSPQSLGYAAGGVPPATNLTAFQYGGSEAMTSGGGTINYINSTEFSDANGWSQNYVTANQTFTHQGNVPKSTTGGNLVRAMRQSII